MRTTWKPSSKKTKLTFLLSLTFLFLFGCQTVGWIDPMTKQRIISSALQGNADAQNDLGVMYQNGEGVPQDYKEAVKWYRLSAEQGDDGAQQHLGNMYKKGLGVLQDYQEAVRLFRLSAEQGFAVAQYHLEMMHGNSPN